jgi:hypothetical protein
MQLLRKIKYKNIAGGWDIKFKFCFLEITHEPLNLNKWIFVQWKIMEIPTSFTWIIIFLDGAFECGDGGKFWGYIGTNAEPLCVKFCNFA